MESSRISVVIPTCDRPDYLLECLQSVAEQTLLPHEVVVVDNSELPTRPSADWPFRLTFFRALPRFGVAQARNLGALMSEGDYVSFLDDDDRWAKDYLEQVVAATKRTGAGVVLGRLRDLQSGEAIHGKQSQFEGATDLMEALLVRNPGTVGSAITVKKSCFIRTAGFDPCLTPSEDKALVLDLLLQGVLPARAENAWVDFRTHAGERLTESGRLRRGKSRFLRKYWHLMTWKSRTKSVITLLRLHAFRVVHR